MHKFLLAAVMTIASVTSAHAAEVKSMMLLYQAQEPGVAPYASRILVTERYVRMDDGVDDGDYLVFDRREGLISSVTHNDQSVFEIPRRAVTAESPLPLELRTRALDVGEDTPQVGGKRPQHHKLHVNEQLCYSVVSVPGLMNDAVAALGEFRLVLAGEHAKMLSRLPADMQDACDLAVNTFEPQWQLQFGLPIQEWDEKGNRQMLMNFDPAFEVDEALFDLPQNYHHYSTDEL